mmetsp:Transcript_9210/g.26918  ORF Transcript_9210/g.26918 Transcript_9210/m.26918 type:complete len:215 (-) Transcript_9210:975-1619(-)
MHVIDGVGLVALQYEHVRELSCSLHEGLGGVADHLLHAAARVGGHVRPGGRLWRRVDAEVDVVRPDLIVVHLLDARWRLPQEVYLVYLDLLYVVEGDLRGVLAVAVAHAPRAPERYEERARLPPRALGRVAQRIAAHAHAGLVDVGARFLHEELDDVVHAEVRRGVEAGVAQPRVHAVHVLRIEVRHDPDGVQVAVRGGLGEDVGEERVRAEVV